MKAKCDEALSNFAANFNLRRYVKKSIVDYTLRNPTERQRLGLRALEELLPVPGAVQAGAYTRPILSST